MNAGSAQGRLPDAIRQERQAAEDLVALLREEQRALVAGDADGVAGGLPAKASLLARLAGLGERRSALLRSLGISDIAAIDRGFAADAEVMASWQGLRSATREAWRQNAINGALISERLLANQNALAALSPPGRSLYGRHGRSVSGWDSRELGAA
jgi:flagella synthesis protein FlgN